MDFKLYFLDADGRVRERVDLDCDDDDHAVREALARADGRAMELWRRAEVVRKFPLSEPPHDA